MCPQVNAVSSECIWHGSKHMQHSAKLTSGMVPDMVSFAMIFTILISDCLNYLKVNEFRRLE